MIGDRRLRNWFEAKIPSVSRGLPTASLMSVLEVDPRRQCLRICAADRRDFYHQFKVSEQRAATNGLWPLLSVSDLEGTQALAAWQQHKHGPYVRTKHGDQFGRPDRRSADRRPQVLQACFSSIPQGDHLGVEFATDAHKTFLEGHGLFCQREDLRADSVFRGTEVLQGLVIDDFFTVSVETADKEGHEDNPPAVQSRALQRFQLAKQAYQSADLKGSDDKDLVDLTRAKVIGGEIDSACSTRRLGLTTLAAPAKKRLALAYLSAEIAQLPYTTDALHVCLLGGWVHALMYRRPLMCVLDKAFKLVDATKLDADKPKLVALPRGVAEELLVIAVLAPFLATNLAAVFEPAIYATDASDAKGAFVACKAPLPEVRALWRTGRKIGGYARMLTRAEALIQKLDPSFQLLSEGHPAVFEPQSIERPRAHRFHFIELCGGAGKVSKFLAERGWVCGPIIDLDASPFFNLRMLRLLSWVYHLFEQALLDSAMIEPPCTTFSPAQHPASRGYDQPRGYQPLEEKTLEGTELALRSLAIIKLCASLRKPGLLEQPRKSKMRRLEEWIALLALGLAEENWAASCAYGSPHQKEFVFLSTGLPAGDLHRKCTRDHQHIPIQGKWTKQSAVYTDQLAWAIAECFHKGLYAMHREARQHSPKTLGLESVLCNDVLLSHSWQVLKALALEKTHTYQHPGNFHNMQAP